MKPRDQVSPNKNASLEPYMSLKANQSKLANKNLSNIISQQFMNNMNRIRSLNNQKAKMSHQITGIPIPMKHEQVTEKSNVFNNPKESTYSNE